MQEKLNLLNQILVLTESVKKQQQKPNNPTTKQKRKEKPTNWIDSNLINKKSKGFLTKLENCSTHISFHAVDVNVT